MESFSEQINIYAIDIIAQIWILQIYCKYFKKKKPLQSKSRNCMRGCCFIFFTYIKKP